MDATTWSSASDLMNEALEQLPIDKRDLFRAYLLGHLSVHVSGKVMKQAISAAKEYYGARVAAEKNQEAQK